MGMSYSCEVFYGVVLNPHKVTTCDKVTRYDEKTGKPYLKEVKYTRNMLGDREWNDVYDKLYEIEQEDGIVTLLYNYEEHALGIRLASAGMCEREDEVELDILTDENKEELRQTLAQFGITEEPRIILWFQVM